MQFYHLVLRLLVDESMKPIYHLISQYYHFRTFAAWTRTAILHWVNPLLCEYLLYIAIHWYTSYNDIHEYHSFMDYRGAFHRILLSIILQI